MCLSLNDTCNVEINFDASNKISLKSDEFHYFDLMELGFNS